MEDENEKLIKGRIGEEEKQRRETRRMKERKKVEVVCRVSRGILHLYQRLNPVL